MAANYPTTEQPPPNIGESKHNGALIVRDENSITVAFDGQLEGPRIPKKGDFDENLAELMDDASNVALARRLKEYLDVDKESRKDWYDRSCRGLALMGIADLPKEDTEGDSAVNSPGQAQVKMPMLSEATTHFQARAIAELVPATGPVKAMIVGPRTRERVEQSDRVETFSNDYLMRVDEGYFPDTDQMLMCLPQAGSVFRKAAQNWVTGMPELRYVPAERFIVPYAAKDLRDAPRYAEEFSLSGQDVRRAMESGMFKKVVLKKPMMMVNTRKGEDRSDGRRQSEHDDDATYALAEYHIDMEFPIDAMGTHASKEIGVGTTQDLLSYVVIVELENEKILMVRRNWKKGDSKRRRRIWFAHHKFFPGLGFYGWGYPHLLGTLQKAISDGVNALLDAGFAANFQGGFATKEAKAAGISGDLALEHGVWKTVAGSYDELAKALWSPDFKPPSPALEMLVRQLIEAFRSFASITEAAIGEADNRGPVGTTLALIEQSNIIPTAIHKRLHFSFGVELKMWAELVYDFMPNVYNYEISKEKKQLLKSDFDGRVDIVPVSDPNIWSQKQRITLSQAVIQLQQQDPSLYQPTQRVEAHRRLMEAMRVPDIESVAPQLTQPKYLDPIAENGLIAVRSGVRAYEQQDHDAHMKIHANGRAMLVGSPYFGQMLPETQQAILNAYDAHQAEHMALLYRRMIATNAGIPLPPLGADGMEPELTPDIEAQITAAVVNKLPPPPPPPASADPNAAAAAAIDAKTQASIKAQKDESTAQMERDHEAFVAEQARLETAHKEEMRRKREAANADESRKDTVAATQLVREGAKTRAQVKAEAVKAAQQRQYANVDKGQQLQHAEAEHKQEVRHAETEHKQDLEQGKTEHKQEVQQAATEHKQDQTHAKQAGTLKIQQARAQAKAKKVAAKKTGSKK